MGDVGWLVCCAGAFMQGETLYVLYCRCRVGLATLMQGGMQGKDECKEEQKK